MSLPKEPKKPKPKLFSGERDRRDRPKKQEQRVAGALGGRTQPASGALEGMKGDVRVGHTGEGWLIECKRTKHRSLSVKASWLGKITREARAKGKTPALAIEMDMAGESATEKDWVAIPLSEFKRLTEGE